MFHIVIALNYRIIAYAAESHLVYSFLVCQFCLCPPYLISTHLELETFTLALSPNKRKHETDAKTWVTLSKYLIEKTAAERNSTLLGGAGAKMGESAATIFLPDFQMGSQLASS